MNNSQGNNTCSSIHIFLSQTKIIDDSNINNSQIKQWLYNNRYTIAILEEILEKVEYKKV